MHKPLTVVRSCRIQIMVYDPGDFDEHLCYFDLFGLSDESKCKGSAMNSLYTKMPDQSIELV